MLKTMIVVLAIELGAILAFAFGLWLDEQDKRRTKRRQKCRQRYMRSVEAAGRRLMLEDRISHILNEPIKLCGRKPIRKACGLFSSDEAQNYVKK